MRPSKRCWAPLPFLTLVCVLTCHPFIDSTNVSAAPAMQLWGLQSGSSKDENRALFIFLRSASPHHSNVAETEMCLTSSEGYSCFHSVLFFLEVHKVMVHPNQGSLDLMRCGNSSAYSASHCPALLAALTALRIFTR